MGLKRWIKHTTGRQARHERLTILLADAVGLMAERLEKLEQLECDVPDAEPSLAHQVAAGEAFVLGVDPAGPDGGLVIAYRVPKRVHDDEPQTATEANAGVVIDRCACGQPATWHYSPSLKHGIVDLHRHPDAVGYCGTHGPNTPWVPAEEAEPEDVPADEQRREGVHVTDYVSSIGVPLEHIRGDEFPSAEEINNALRIGLCDDPGLIGRELVLYETDGRGGKRYALPAIVTCVQRSHVDLPVLRAAEENGYRAVFRGNTWHDEWPLERGTGVVSCLSGIRVGTNPLPIPHEGTVHLTVFTPGEQTIYREMSVPYDPTGASPRSWRFHPDATPF